MPQPSPTLETHPELFLTPEAEAIKNEICAVGQKLWLRQYVDGNGGNISCRIGPNEVLCTPTLVSKYDLTAEDLCLVDLEGNQLAGSQRRTSEIFLHLEIYKAAPEVKAVLHCHPPHATAHAITHTVPEPLTLPEFEVFLGKVPITPYATPGTAEFARTVAPFAKHHNCAILANHGIVCWGDTVTHAEWFAENLETYCWTMLLARQLGAPITYFNPQQVEGVLDIKRRYGLPDHRLAPPAERECTCGPAIEPNPLPAATTTAPALGRLTGSEFDLLVQSVAAAVLEKIAAQKP
jgi:L-fuculose-phosphate aldolase